MINIEYLVNEYNEGLKTRSPTFFSKEKITNLVNHVIFLRKKLNISNNNLNDHWLLFIFDQLKFSGNQIAVFQIWQLILEISCLQKFQQTWMEHEKN